MRILAIDPGSSETGWVITQGDPPMPPCDMGISPNIIVADMIRADIFDLLVIESIPAVYGHSAKPQLCDTMRWEGRFIERADQRGCGWKLIERARVKALLCRAANAKDSDVRAELNRRWGSEDAVGSKKEPGPLRGVKGDIWAALAVAVWARETMAT